MKPWYTSKTIWFNFLTILAMIAVDPAVQAFFGPHWKDGFLMLAAVANIFLRVVTSKPVV